MLDHLDDLKETNDRTNRRATVTEPASKERLERTTAALIANNFAVEIHDNAAAARARTTELIPEGASVLTASSETLRQSGIDDDNNTSGRYQALKRRLLAMDRTICADDIRRLMACPDFVVGSVAADTETGALVVPSASGGQLPSYAGGSRVILVRGTEDRP